MIRKKHVNRVQQANPLIKSYLFLNTLGKMFCLLCVCYFISYLEKKGLGRGECRIFIYWGQSSILQDERVLWMGGGNGSIAV